MPKAILFDLDDTLYEEREFFRSGFEAVGGFLADRGFGSGSETADLLEHLHHAEGREGVLQKLAARMRFPGDWVPELTKVFRGHTPRIRLIDEAPEALTRLRRHFRLGCVTDGWAAVQRAKIRALDVERFLDVVLVSDDYGRDRWKPHPYPFLKCCELLGVAPVDAVFVGDHPGRDVAGARNAGLQVVRMKRPTGYFAKMNHEIDQDTPVVESLIELESAVGKMKSLTRTLT